MPANAGTGANRSPNASCITPTTFSPTSIPTSSSRVIGPTGKPNSTISRSTSRSEEHTSELQSPCNLVCRLLLEKKKRAEQYRSGQYLDNDYYMPCGDDRPHTHGHC